jgi:prepilin-type N-terminal cleavage/methylation domain-containing protein
MKKQGFTLVEVLIAMILVGLAIAALMAANRALTQANSAGTELSTGELLAEQVRELTMMTDYPSLLGTFDGVTYSPPKGADGATLSGFDNYSQVVTVENVSDTDFETVVDDGTSHFQKITVKVLFNSEQICLASWVRAER